MNTYVKILSATVVLLGAMAAPNFASAQTLKMGGTGSVTEMLRLIAPTFKAETGIALVVIPSLGASGGNAAAADGVLGISVSGRELKDEEIAKGLKVAARFSTPFVLATSRPGPDGLRSQDIAGLYAAPKATWPDGAPVRIILRPLAESDTTIMGKMFPGMAEALAEARKRPDLSVAATDQDNVDAALSTEGSLIGTTLTQMLNEKPDLRLVAIDGVEPSMANFENGTYPHGKALLLVVPAAITPEAESFLSFIATPKGQALLREAGLVASKQ